MLIISTMPHEKFAQSWFASDTFYEIFYTLVRVLREALVGKTLRRNALEQFRLWKEKLQLIFIFSKISFRRNLSVPFVIMNDLSESIVDLEYLATR